MDIVLIGTSHRIATVDVRSRIAAAVRSAEVRLGAQGVVEYLVLATCHRVEIYAIAADADAVERTLRGAIEAAGAAFSETYVLTGVDAVRHLGRVACGLDSMVIGEAEIAGQIRRAVAAAKDAGTSGPHLDRLVAGALRASGRARSETRIGVGVVSAASAAVSLVERALGRLAQRSVLVVGAGQAGRQALSRLAKVRSGPRFVASRSKKHADEAAAKVDASVVSLEDLPAVAARVDAVIATAQAPSYLLTADAYRAAATAHSVFMIDLSAPRVLDPALADVSGVTLRTVDDLGDIVRESTRRRLKEVPRVEAIALDEARRAYEQFNSRVQRRRVSARS